MERLVGWLWHRWRAHFRVAVAGTVLTICLAVYLPSALVMPVYFDLGVDAGVGWAAALVATLLVAFGFGYLTGHGDHWLTVERWCAGDPSDPAGVLQTALSLPRRLVNRTVAIGAVASLAIPGVYWTVVADLSLIGILALCLFFAGAVSVGRGLLSPLVDLLFRPLRTEASSVLGQDVGLRPPSTGPRLSARIVATGRAIAWTCGLFLPAVALLWDDPDTRFAAVVTGVVLIVTSYASLALRALAVAPILRPVQDLTIAARRIGDGRFDNPLPVTSDDELGELVIAFNDMQRGLREREHLLSAFGSYVDPALAQRLLEQGDELFRGERREVTVLFADIRDFTPFAEAHTAEETVAHLNALFEIIVPVIAAHGGHTNKFLGDGAMAVFGAPETLDSHADRASAAAQDVVRQVWSRFDGRVRLGIGLHTGSVIAGSIGGGGKLEFTLIGDTVNVASRVEQLTKRTGDRILLTQQTVESLTKRPDGLMDRGAHELKGKSDAVTVYALEPTLTQAD